MIKRSTLILVIVFLLALSGYLLFNRQQEQAAAQITPTPSSQPLFELGEREITSLQVSDAGGRAVRLEKIAGAWTLIDPQAQATDHDRAEALAAQVAALATRSFLESTPETNALRAFGLDAPAYTIQLKLSDGSALRLAVGAETPTQSGVYVRVDEGRVAVVNTYSLEAITAILDDPPIYVTPTVGLTPLGPEMLPTSGAATTPTP